MCFSASASFVAAGALGAGGVATLTKIRTKREIPLALMPLLFGVQQFIEGIQWLSDKPSAVSTAMAYAFLIFAFVLWPIYIPTSVLLVETHSLRRKIIPIFFAIGIGVSSYSLFILLKYPIATAITKNHIEYLVDIPWALGVAPYALATVGSCLASSHRMIIWFGVGIFLSLMTSLALYASSFGSVWCFFSAILSTILYFHF